MAIIILLGLVPLVLPYLELRQQVSLHIPLDDVDFWSASVSDYLLPPGLHPIWGKWVRERLLSVPMEYPQISLEFVLGIGWIGLLFAIYGWRRSRHPARKASTWFMICALVLSLGPRLHLGRFPVVIPAPDQLVEFFHRILNTIGAALPSSEGYHLLQAEGITIPLPALLLLFGLLLLLGILTPFDIISAERQRIAAIEQEMNLISREIKTLQGDTETHELRELEEAPTLQVRLRPLQERLARLRVD